MASLIGLSLFRLLTTTRKSVARIHTTIEMDTPFIAFYNQVEKDVLGMFAPRSSVSAFVAEQTKESKKTEKKANKIIVIKPVMSIVGKSNSFFWSFITTGAMTLLDKYGHYNYAFAAPRCICA